MMKKFLIFILIFLIIFIVMIIKFRKPKKSCIIAYSGKLGGGKTYNMTCDALKFYKKSLIDWNNINNPCLIRKLIRIIPYFRKRNINKESYGLDKPLIYSNYPILIKKGVYSEILTNDIMFCRKSIPLNSIVVIDEFSSWISQFNFKEVYSDTLNDHIQKFRHYHGNLSHLIVSDQCSNNIPIQVRYRLNQVCCCLEIKHILKFIHITKYKYIDLTDDIKSVEIIDDDNSDTDDKVLRMIRFKLKKSYDDRAFSNRYFFVDKNVKNVKYIDSPLKIELGLLKPMLKENYPILDVEIKKDIMKKG